MRARRKSGNEGERGCHGRDKPFLTAVTCSAKIESCHDHEKPLLTAVTLDMEDRNVSRS